MDNVFQNQSNVKLLRICSVLKKDHSNVLLEFVLNNQTYVFHNILETEILITSKKLIILRSTLILDVLLNNHIDVLMVHAERIIRIVQFNLDVHNSDYNIDVYQEDALLTLLNVLNSIKI
jgi:hypothetical protein